MEFEGFPKMHRLNREIVITEKIDGTNAQVYITDEGEVLVGSRTRWITPEEDNAGFAKWVQANREDLLKLGIGRHFGEWWGRGIQRGYGLSEKRFSLFNTSRWSDPDVRPVCCSVVPVLYQGPFCQSAIRHALEALNQKGSIASPTFMRPEGIVIFHTQGNFCLKVTLEKDEAGKGQ